MVHSRAGFAHIGEADVKLEQGREFMRLVAARRKADRVDRTPEAVSRMRVVMAGVG
jgi:hypothetical protein